MTSVRAFEEMRQRVEIVTCLRIALRLRRELLGIGNALPVPAYHEAPRQNNPHHFTGFAISSARIRGRGHGLQAAEGRIFRQRGCCADSWACSLSLTWFFWFRCRNYPFGRGLFYGARLGM
jgi:hypothetical protein